MAGRPLADVAGVVLAAIAKRAPANVDREAITVTGEGTQVVIVLVPHRDLDGIAMVVWADHEHIELLWAHVGDLSTHDDIDLGVSTAKVAWDDTWQDRLDSAVAAELVRPLRLRRRRALFGKTVVDCWLDLKLGAKRIGIIHPKGEFSAEGPRPDAQWETALAAGNRLPFSAPPPLATWRRNT